MESKLTVAILDDDALSRLILEHVVETAGMVAASFAAPDQFLDYIRTNKPACILLDMNMPNLSGVEVQCRLHEMGITVPVIMVTGDSDVPTATAALLNGAADFVAKPIDGKELVCRIREICGPISIEWN
jgi:two-component system, LuxR family, response regulator FixJ